MTAVNQEVDLAGQDNDDFQAKGKQRPEHHPRPGGEVHTHTAGEIVEKAVKSSSVSPPATKEAKQKLRKLVSNELRDLHGEGQLVKVKRGVYRRSDTMETNQIEVDENDSTPEIQFIETESLKASYHDIRKSCRTDFSETSSKPLPLRLPINLEDDFLVFQGNLIGISGTKNAGKTLMAIDTIRRNMNSIPCTYINFEMRGGELKNWLTASGQAYGITFEELEAKAEFFDCGCNALDEAAMFHRRGSSFWPPCHPALECQHPGQRWSASACDPGYPAAQKLQHYPALFASVVGTKNGPYGIVQKKKPSGGAFDLHQKAY